MRTLAWSTVLYFSPFTAWGMVVFFPCIVVAAYVIRSWSWVIAIMIVSMMLGIMNAQADERLPMDADTCNEHQGDVMEHFYSTGWKITKKSDDEWIKRKGNVEVSFRCERGLSIIETRPVASSINGQVEYNK